MTGAFLERDAVIDLRLASWCQFSSLWNTSYTGIDFSRCNMICLRMKEDGLNLVLERPFLMVLQKIYLTNFFKK